MAEQDYNLTHSGQEIDQAVGKVGTIESDVTSLKTRMTAVEQTASDKSPLIIEVSGESGTLTSNQLAMVQNDAIIKNGIAFYRKTGTTTIQGATVTIYTCVVPDYLDDSYSYIYYLTITGNAWQTYLQENNKVVATGDGDGNLTTLKVGLTTYDIPQGGGSGGTESNKYEHHLYLKSNTGNLEVSFTLTNSSSDLVTSNNLISKINETGCDGENKPLMATGVVYNSDYSTIMHITGICSGQSYYYKGIRVIGYILSDNYAKGFNKTNLLIESFNSVVDIVQEI